MVIPETLNRSDPFESRIAIAAALEKIAPLLSAQLVVPVFDFLVIQEALGDRHGEVRRTMLTAGIAIIDAHGDKTVAELMKMFEEYLAKDGPSSETADFIKEAVVIVCPLHNVSRHVLTRLSSLVVSQVISSPPTHAFLKSSTD